MKQLLFLLLFPCLALAQYTGNAGQKITLGEQTTADGLVFRGNAADTVAATLKITKTNKSDTSAFLLLDTLNNVLLKYNIATTYWTRLNILPTDTASILGNYWRSGRFSGVLPVANGGTNASTFTAGSVVFAGASGTSLAQDNSNLFWNNTDKRLAIGQTTTLSGARLSVRGGIHLVDQDTTDGTDTNFYIYPKEQTTSGPNSTEFAMFVAGPNSTSTEDGPVIALRGNNYVRNANQKGLLIISSSTNVAASGNNGKILFISQHGLYFQGESTFNSLAGTESRAVLADANGVLSAPVSSITTKENVQVLDYGLNEILQIKPVSFDYINKDKWGDERNLGFIIEDMYPIVPEVTGTMNNGDMYLDMTKLIPILTKAIQEQQDIIKALEQRILTLENK